MSQLRVFFKTHCMARVCLMNQNLRDLNYLTLPRGLATMAQPSAKRFFQWLCVEQDCLDVTKLSQFWQLCLVHKENLYMWTNNVLQAVSLLVYCRIPSALTLLEGDWLKENFPTVIIKVSHYHLLKEYDSFNLQLCGHSTTSLVTLWVLLGEAKVLVKSYSSNVC